MNISPGSDPDPLWFKDAVIYEVHVRSFFDSNDDGVGDFPGLIQKLDYLQKLGVTCLWLLPFYPSPLKDDGYDISDYFGVNPAYGHRRDFRRFVKEAHRRGMRVITELVINHTSDRHPLFQAARNAPPGSPERDFYVWSDTDRKFKGTRIIFTDSEKSNWTWDDTAKAYYWHRFFQHQPDLNFDNPAVLKAVERVMRFWLDLGVDGLRLDAVPYLVEREGTSCENLPETHAVLKRLRRAMDERFKGRVFLAEANQWPTDVRPYFGEGDECHMAFHFPLMPRIFMALRQEDRHPITEILRQTPDIPENCQWALFLRNHDELTLEMVTTDERDYMNREYAADPLARVNLGIRRRLAPLAEHSRRRLELLNSLLLSLPGTPVLYYGDEIGMGDNVHLGDRNGVRTPMQWTGDRNAGFSQADPEKLFLPVVTDPVSGYQAVNVGAQQTDPSSLLNWMKRMIALRRRFKVFGRGSLQVLYPKNRQILAYVRKYGEETVLVVANISRFAQPVELELGEYKGAVPVEMLGQVRFPPIGDWPYFLTLGPHSFFWFLLQKKSSSSAAAATEDEGPPGEAIETGEGWKALFSDLPRRALEANPLPSFLSRQRWFIRKARMFRSARILDWGVLGDAPEAACFCLVEVRYSDGESDVFSLPMSTAQGAEAEEIARSTPAAVIARLKTPQGGAVLYDALYDAGACRALLSLIEGERAIATQKGTLRGFATSLYSSLKKDLAEPAPARRSLAEQTNTSILFAERFILKMYRRIEPGVNPDLEIGRHLTERTSFSRIARTAGGLEYVSGKGGPASAGFLQGFVEHQGDGWKHAQDELGRFFERTAGKTVPVSAGGLQDVFDMSGQETPPEVREFVGPYLVAAETLGQRTAEFHLALGAEASEEGFRPEPLTPSYWKPLAEQMRQNAARGLRALESRLGRYPEETREWIHRLLAGRKRLLDRIRIPDVEKRPAGLIRCHGDFHLGQVLWQENDFILIDFEGEPLKTPAERRAKQCPLKDVAGMIRSFHYAANAWILDVAARRGEAQDPFKPWARLWAAHMSATFLKGYRAAVAGALFIPATDAEVKSILDFFLLDKTLYELVYELEARPEWVKIPLQDLAGEG